MMDFKIGVSKKDGKVYICENIPIGRDGENLQSRFIFTFTDEFVNGTARIEYYNKEDEEKYFQILTKEEEQYTIPIKSVITKKGTLYMQLVITESEVEEEIPIFKSNVFYVFVEKSINAEIEQPDEYPTWIEIANSKLASMDEAIEQVENLNITASKEDKITTITITDKQGEEHTTEILDGENGVGLDYNWQGTSLGIKREDQENYDYTDLKGDIGDSYFSTFGIEEDGNLYMYRPEELTQIGFEVDNDGYLVELMEV